MMHERPSPAKVLTIAGSDSGGAAGLQADLKTWTRLGVYGMSVVTVVTAQNSVSVQAIQPLSPDFVARQIDAVLSDYGADAVKTGFLGSVDLIQTIAGKLRRILDAPYRPLHIVIDPVLVNHRGEAMFPPQVTQAYQSHLLPLADLLTPNRFEASLLTGIPLPQEMNNGWLEETASQLHDLGPKHVLIKGGRIGAESVDIFFDEQDHQTLTSPWIDSENTHGSGDTLSAAACAFLAQGESMKTSVVKARHFTAAAIRRAAHWQLGHGHGPVIP